MISESVLGSHTLSDLLFYSRANGWLHDISASDIFNYCVERYGCGPAGCAKRPPQICTALDYSNTVSPRIIVTKAVFDDAYYAIAHVGRVSMSLLDFMIEYYKSPVRLNIVGERSAILPFIRLSEDHGRMHVALRRLNELDIGVVARRAARAIARLLTMERSDSGYMPDDLWSHMDNYFDDCVSDVVLYSCYYSRITNTIRCRAVIKCVEAVSQ